MRIKKANMHQFKNCLKLQQNYCFLNLQAPKNKNYSMQNNPV